MIPYNFIELFLNELDNKDSKITISIGLIVGQPPNIAKMNLKSGDIEKSIQIPLPVGENDDLHGHRYADFILSEVSAFLTNKNLNVEENRY